MFSEEHIVARRKLREPRAYLRVTRLIRPQAGVSDGNAGIAQEPAPLGSLHRAAAKRGAKFFDAERNQPFQLGTEKGVTIEHSWLEIRLCRLRRSPVPRTNILANVAAEYVSADGLAKFGRN
jgi:hypothetical protein